MQEQYIKSIHSSQFNTSSRHDSNIAYEQNRDEQIAIIRKPIPQRPATSVHISKKRASVGARNRPKQKSMVYLRGKIPVKQAEDMSKKNLAT